MIRYLGESKRYKTARTELPQTAEFKPLRVLLESKDQVKKGLLNSATAALSKTVTARRTPQAKPIVPDDLYEATLGDSGLLTRWEKTFDGSDNARKLFGLLAWRYFFNDDSTWLAKASDSPRLGKRAWSYHVEREAGGTRAAVKKKRVEPQTRATPVLEDKVQPEAAPPAAEKEHEESPVRGIEWGAMQNESAVLTELPTEAAGLVLNQCVLWTTERRYGRIVGEPREHPNDFLATQQFVRFASRMGEPVNRRQKWIDTENLAVADQDKCKQIEPVE